jgi:hypothetical protein
VHQGDVAASVEAATTASPSGSVGCSSGRCVATEPSLIAAPAPAERSTSLNMNKESASCVAALIVTGTDIAVEGRFPRHRRVC